MNRRNFFGTFAKGVAVAVVAPTVIASALNTPTPAMSVTTKAFSGSVSGGMWLADEIGKTASKFASEQEYQLLIGDKWLK